MKKIMFNDNYRLTQAVLRGTKTMTRRFVSPSVINSYDAWYKEFLYKRTGEEPYQTLEEHIINSSEYKVGEVVSISQSYKAVFEEKLASFGNAKANEWWYKAIRSAIVPPSKIAGYKNKMFVKADLMPHHIKITDVKVEHLQDISDEDILREEFWQFYDHKGLFYISKNIGHAPTVAFLSAREAFEYLIDKVSGKGTWESNPLVVAYSFELLD